MGGTTSKQPIPGTFLTETQLMSEQPENTRQPIRSTDWYALYREVMAHRRRITTQNHCDSGLGIAELKKVVRERQRRSHFDY